MGEAKIVTFVVEDVVHVPEVLKVTTYVPAADAETSILPVDVFKKIKPVVDEKVPDVLLLGVGSEPLLQ